MGKFIALMGTEAPTEDTAGCVQANLGQAIEGSREELTRNEEMMLMRTRMV